jgi:hypothetical protein
LKNPVAAPVTAASAASIQTSAAPAISNAAIAPWLTKRTTSAATITVRRGSRSATTPPASSRPTSGSIRAASTRPSSDAEPPSPSTANASATLTIPSPSSETACPR